MQLSAQKLKLLEAVIVFKPKLPYSIELFELDIAKAQLNIPEQEHDISYSFHVNHFLLFLFLDDYWFRKYPIAVYLFKLKQKHVQN